MSNVLTKSPGPEADGVRPGTHSIFVPLLLLLIAFIMVVGWTLVVAARQSANLERVQFQVRQATAQSVQAEEKLKGLLSDLAILAEEDPDAAAIVKRYKIKQKTAQAASAAASGSTVKPAAKPADKPAGKPAAKPAEPPVAPTKPAV